MVGILGQVEHQHAQVAVIGQDAQVVRGQFQMLDDTVALRVKIEQLQRVAHRPVERDDLRLLPWQAGKQQQALGDAGTSVDFRIHHFQIAADAFRIGISLTKIPQQAVNGKAH